MESTVPVVRLVKCPKCFKILTEFAEVPVYKCGGCGAILRAKAQSSSLQDSSTVPANHSSQNLPGIDPLSNESVNLRKKTDLNESIAVEKPLDQDQSTNNNVLDSEGSEELEQSLEVNHESNGTLKSSDKLNDSSETMEHCITSEEDVIKLDFTNKTHFKTNTRSSSRAYDGSASSTDEDMNDHTPRKYLLSRRTCRDKFVSDSLGSREAEENSVHDIQAIEKDGTFGSQAPFRSPSCPTKDSQVKINRRSSEQEDRVKILNKVDELRNELRGLFNETANDKEFKGKVPPIDYRSSHIPFSKDSHVCTLPSDAAALPFNTQSSTINQRPHDLQHKALRSQSIVRLCRPVSGGAPFVICYKCFKLLQLPADFLVSPKKVHKLRCGSCLQVLLFSFKPRARSVPQTPEEFQHPPSEETILSQFEGNNTGSDPISTSEDSYFSLAKSNSSEVEPDFNNSRSFDEIVEEEEEGMHRNVIGSRLHNLLGYSSATELLFNTNYSYDGHRRMDSDTPSFYKPSGRRRWERH